MILLTLTVVTLCFSNLVLSASVVPNLRTALEKNLIIPDVLDNFPQNLLGVKYPRGDEVLLGNELSSELVKDKPQLKWPVEPNTLYAIAMVDPDALHTSSKPNWLRGKHWMVINIPGFDVDKGQLVLGYMGSDPQTDTGAHRYVFVAFKQSKKIVVSPGSIPLTGPISDQLGKFIETYEVEAVAINFFQTHF